MARPLVTVIETPTHRAEPEETQVLFEEARRRRKRRRLVGGMAVIAVVLVGIAVGLLVTQGNGPSPRPVTPAAPAPSAAAATASSFSIRPVLCYAPPFDGSTGQAPPTRPLPTCAPPYQLTASHLQVTPASNNVAGYTANSTIAADPQFAGYPSTMSSSRTQGHEVILSGSPGSGPNRYVLGPVGLSRSAIARARVTENNGQWAIALVLTPRGSAQWDSFVEQTFHAISAVVIHGQVVSAPIMQPTQSLPTSFHGQLQISGGFTQQQAKAIAASL
jgi:hypothetical protein